VHNSRRLLFKPIRLLVASAYRVNIRKAIRIANVSPAGISIKAPQSPYSSYFEVLATAQPHLDVLAYFLQTQERLP
jgi:hypothetical protein